jgi:hypothetical protein
MKTTVTSLIVVSRMNDVRSYGALPFSIHRVK